MNLSRRSVLAGIGGGILALGGAMAVRAVTPGAAAPGFAVLDAEAVRIGRVLAARLVGEGPAMAVPVMEEIDQTLLALPEVGEVWRRLPLVFERAPLLAGGLSPFTGLPAAEQEALIAAWLAAEAGWKRRIIRGLRDLICSHVYMHPASWAAIRYDGPWVGRIALPVHAPRFAWGAP